MLQLHFLQRGAARGLRRILPDLGEGRAQAGPPEEDDRPFYEVLLMA
jgi:hypothetical protein